MLDNKVKILPSHIQKGGGDDDESDMLVTFSFLLENYLYQNWKDADLLAFINLMRNPGTRVKDLVTHPLLLPPDQRELLYRTTWTRMSNSLQNTISYPTTTYWATTTNCHSFVPSGDTALQGILRFPNGPHGVITYPLGFVGVHKFCHDTSSHYLKSFRENYVPGQVQLPVDLLLKRTFPGLISEIYLLTLDPDWGDI